MTVQRNLKTTEHSPGQSQACAKGDENKEQYSRALEEGSLCFKVVPWHQSTIPAHSGVTLSCHHCRGFHEDTNTSFVSLTHQPANTIFHFTARTAQLTGATGLRAASLR